MTLPVYLTILGVIAFAAAIAGVLGVFAASQWVRRFGVIVTFIWLATAVSVVNVVGSTREFGVNQIFALYYMTPFTVWSSRISSLAFATLAILAILMNFRKQRQHRGGSALWLTYSAFFLSVVASSVLGAKPDFSHQIIYTWLIMTAVYMSAVTRTEQVVAHAKYAAAVIMYGSLILAPILPSFYVETGYKGIIPGFDIRLHGLANHANNLGPLALFYLLLEYWIPSARPWRRLNATVALAVLILAQSKTAWIMSAISIFAIVILRMVVKLQKEWDRSSVSLTTFGFLFSVFVFLLGLGYLLVFGWDTMFFQRVFGADEGVRTLTGRTEIWEITLEAWRNNPWFGYGPSLWDLEFRMKYGIPAAVNAHNQFFQTLGESGVIGFLGLLFYVGALIGYALKFSVRTKGVSIALVLMLLIRSMTEVPFRMFLSLDVAFMIHLAIFTLLIMLARTAGANQEIKPAKHWESDSPARLGA